MVDCHLFFRDGLRRGRFWETPSLPLPLPNVNTSHLGQNRGLFGNGWVGGLVESSTDLKSVHLPMICPHHENESERDKVVK